MRQILHVDMDAFFVSVEELRDPSLIGLPVVVGGSSETRGVVAAASYAARKFGIHSAMSMARASKLCPSLVRVSGRGSDYSAYSRSVFDIFRRYTPWVQQTSIDEGYLDLTGFESLYGNLVPVCAGIRQAVFDELGLHCSLGLSTARMVSKVASELGKPRGMVVVLPGQEAAFLRPLDVGRIPGIGPKMQEQLHRLGVHTVGDLQQLDERLLEEKFGVHGPAMLQRALGQDRSVVHLEKRAPKSIGAETTFPEDLTNRTEVRAALRRLVEKSARRMRAKGYGCSCVTVKLRSHKFQTTTAACTVDEPTWVDQRLFETAARLLDKLWGGRFPVRLVGVRLTRFKPMESSQQCLFDGPDRAEQLVTGIDMVRDRFGFDAVSTGMQSRKKQKDSEKYWSGIGFKKDEEP